ncbi:hypothetical protein F5Y16DRAFT_395558 [Xylariaceae sp. FL0255]|nr:hypothetical protein F5Y16DRAFT_395558 [Xylariaceae sp. FL0255]
MAARFVRKAITPEPGTCHEMVTLKATGGDKTFLVHAEILAHHSKYFRTALNSGFMEATTRTFTLTEHCDDDMLELFVSWVYKEDEEKREDWLNVYFYGNELEGAIQAWLFGDYIQAPTFQNDIISCIIRAWEAGVNSYICCWSTALSGSRLEALFVDMACVTMTYERKEEREEILNALPSHAAELVLRQLVNHILTEGSQKTLARGIDMDGVYTVRLNIQFDAKDYKVEED